ncbi:hypothetical protein UCRPA7_5955 [Phaeoacremonium minimum UCRPA7]|uniref:DUF3752 domain-containing protein n=1 Tax=Phaeoacremonium minimum (strain UCR-PA7) TaxID=1286976 RepID=R8BGW3_PHAM7|nr:hypothetical protein UCRPA7_5955 [Phaeoacremonium minimum UCRPA7]EON98548.1 hypothetical protein UCRPA7_5955 [Phaeoacremonium minimum UCRPA7]
MLAPPTDRGYRVADPTQLKARKFTSGPRAGAGAGGASSSSSSGAGPSSVWFETPEEKKKRLADAVLGRAADPTVHGAAPTATPARAAPQQKGNSSSREQDERIRAFTEQTRGRSLYEEHQTAKAAGRDGKGDGDGDGEEEEDDPSKRAFDREKDMALGGKITHSQRREMLNRAADFGGRFQKGKYL